MNECAQCLAAFSLPTGEQCPCCGAPLAPRPVRAEAAAAKPAVAEAPLDEEAVRFRRQFEERAIHIPAAALRRAEEIVRSAQSEMRRATVLVVDMCEFSRRARDLPPDDLSRLAAEFYDACMGFILGRGGFVVKFLGDAVLAVFGAPVAFDRDTESAVLAALDIRDWGRFGAGDGPPVKVSIGLATGPFRSGVIEGPAGRSYDVLGQTVNLAARLQGAAAEDEILICSDTREITRRVFETESTPPLELKNISDNYVAYRVVGLKAESGARRLSATPFRARERELAALAGFLDQAPGGRTQVAHVEGEAGLGKTRLAAEALRRAGLEGRAIRWEASPAGSAVLLWPVLQWLRSEMRIAPQAGPEEIRKAVREALAKEADAEEADPLLLEYLFGVPEAIAALQGMPPERIQRNLFALLRQMLFTVGGRGGKPGERVVDAERGDPRLVLVADDLHWFDSLSLQFLRSLMDWPAGAPGSRDLLPPGESERVDLRLVLCYRPGPSAPVAAQGPAGHSSREPIRPGSDHLVIRLAPLELEERRALLESLTPAEEFLPEIREVILSKASGNPLFLEEMTRLVRHAMLNYANLSAETLKNHIVDLIPVSLTELIQSRIDRLEARDRQVLQCASLLGLEFTLSLIELFDIIREGLTGHLHALRGMRYLEERLEPRDFRYVFTHALFRDVAYSTLIEEQKQRLHAALARRLEETFADRIQEYCELLAFHFTRGGETEKAIYYRVRAAERQAGLGAAANALENYSDAIELLHALPATAPRQVLMSRLLVQSARLRRTLGAGGEAEEMLGAALDLARELNNERLALEAELEKAVGAVWRGELDKAADELAALAAKAARLGSSSAELVARNALGVAQMQRGRYEKALAAFQELALLAEERGAKQVQADALNNAGLIYWRWGQSAQALKVYRRALPLRQAVGDHFGLCATLMNAGIIQEGAGRVGAARRSYENARRLAEKTGYVQGLAALESNLSNLDRRLGSLAAAQEHAARGIAFAQQAQDPNLEASVRLNAGLACAERGQVQEAASHFHRALALAGEQKNAECELYARLYLLDVKAQHGGADRSDLEEVNAVGRRVEEGGYADLLPLAHRVKAAVLDVLDEHNRFTAREYLQMAIDRAREAGNFFEELDAWRQRAAFLARHGEESADCSAAIQRMEEVVRDTGEAEQ